MWDRWGRTTRFLESARLALGRERRLWDTIEIRDSDAALISVADGTEYRVNVREHRGAIADDQVFYSMVMLYSYALVEAAVAEKLGIQTSELGQVEDWGQRLLELAGTDWTSVWGGKFGIVEVTIYRNAFAHGASTFEQRHLNRLVSCGSQPDWKVGDPIVLDYERMKRFRSRLKSLLRYGQVASPMPTSPGDSD